MADPNVSCSAPDAAPARHRALPRWHYPAACAAGAAHTLSFAPTPHGGWLQLFIFAAFFALLSRTSRWSSAALTGGLFGAGNFITGIWWLYISMHVYGEMNALLAGAALVLAILYLALYPAFSCALWSFCAGHTRPASLTADPRPFSPTWHGAFAFASAWAIGEWLRGTVFTGFPWLASGYPQTDGPFAGYAAVLGIYGVGWVLALFAALTGQALFHACPSPLPSAPAATRRLQAAAMPALVAAALIAGGALLSRVHWTTPSAAPLTVRLLQGNVKQDIKFEEAGIAAALDLYQKLITAKPADLIITPESALPVLLQALPEPFARAVRNFSDNTGSAILLGVIGGTLTDRGEIVDYTNSLYGVTPGSRTLYRYDKHHLVPFGEFIPWGFRWFVNQMKMPLGDFARGAQVQRPFFVRGQPVMANICYEDIFGEEIAATIRGNPQPPGMFVNVTNLGWFGDTIALDQHLQIARMRALETGRPMLRATNTGITAAIDARGQLLGKLAPYTVGTLDVTIEETTGNTPYVTSGNNTVLALSLFLLALGFAFGPNRKTGRATKNT